jgi:methylmalonyl-CoA/ethylmalonyl-CoA epimerase
MKIHHVGIAVESLRATVQDFERLLGRPPDWEEVVEDQNLRAAAFALGESRIELLEPTSPESPVARFLSKHGQGLHHIALAVADLPEILTQLEGAGVRLIDRVPRTGAAKQRIAFLHPASTAGVLIELVEEK